MLLYVLLLKLGFLICIMTLEGEGTNIFSCVAPQFFLVFMMTVENEDKTYSYFCIGCFFVYNNDK